MNKEEVIKRIYGNYYSTIERFLDEYGRVKKSRFIEYCNLSHYEIRLVCDDLRLNSIFENGIEYLQPLALEDFRPEEVPKITTEDENFLDSVALKAMEFYLTCGRPNSFKDNITISKASYAQALAMLEVKKQGLQDLIKVNKLNLKV